MRCSTSIGFQGRSKLKRMRAHGRDDDPASASRTDTRSSLTFFVVVQRSGDVDVVGETGGPAGGALDPTPP